MSDLVETPEDRVSHDEDQFVQDEVGIIAIVADESQSCSQNHVHVSFHCDGIHVELTI